METTTKRSRSLSLNDDPVSQDSSKRVKKSPRYLLVRVDADQGDMHGTIFIPTTPDGDRIVETLKELGYYSRTEAVVEFLNAFTPDETDTAELRAKCLKLIKGFFPFLEKATSFEDVVKQTGVVEEWDEGNYVPVIPLFTSYDY